MRPTDFKSIGTAFERYCTHILRNQGFQLSVIGGTGDKGIDILGNWVIGSHFCVEILGQCKYVTRKMSSSTCREFEGSLSSLFDNWRSRRLSLLFCNQSMSTQCKEQFMSSQFPLMFVKTVENLDDLLMEQFLKESYDSRASADIFPESLMLNAAAKRQLPEISFSIVRSKQNLVKPIILFKGTPLPIN